MSKKSLFIAILVSLAIPALAHAQLGENRDELKVLVENRREINVSGGAGYTDATGWLYGMTGSIGFPFSMRSQFELGGIFYRRADAVADREASGLFGGPLFNFGSDFARNSFLGVGIGYSNIYPFTKEDAPEQRLTYAYVQFGKRFALNSEGTLSFKPRLMSFTRGQGESEMLVDAINFGYLF